MSITNIRFAPDLLKHAGGERLEGAIMPEFNRLLTLKGHFFEQEEVDALAAVLRHPQKDVWLRRREEGGEHELVAGLADNPIDRPSVCTSPGVESSRNRGVPHQEGTSAARPALAYLLVVRGRSAALCSKVRVFYTLSAASAAMFEEVVNGYSIVFSAAMLRSDVAGLGEGGRELRKVDTVQQLYDSAGEAGVIALLCGGVRQTWME